MLLSLAYTGSSTAQNRLRDAGAGCTWKAYEFRDLGVRINYKSCDPSQDQWELRQKDDWIMQHRLGDDVIFGSHYLIKVFTKPENQSIEDAIREQVIAKLEFEGRQRYRSVRRAQVSARKFCEPVDFGLRHRIRAKFLSDDKAGGKVLLELIPRPSSYRRRIERGLQQFPRDFGCGSYGAGQGTRYFEYHPKESKNRFIFVEFGWDDDALFEENSIELFEPAR
ncbi:hypothetical protein [Undibacterium flavidum]|uniref:Uncharacterized protein n=1 Tax=Undibacterium flavidum TaxID=2762297 RepID=A0ABR6Y8Q9_9BURK|nr:hypothetical protein [Undibacterium flavidum]MBC3873011.1 hypothetical protein [Undibacterium flavidum]